MLTRDQYTVTYGEPVITAEGRYGENENALWGPTNALGADLDGDGDEELIVLVTEALGLYFVSPVPIRVFDFRDGILVDVVSEFFSEPPLLMGGQLIFHEDFDGDGQKDLLFETGGTEVVDPFPGGQNRLYLKNESGGFTDRTDQMPQISNFTHGPAIGDFDIISAFNRERWSLRCTKVAQPRLV